MQNKFKNHLIVLRLKPIKYAVKLSIELIPSSDSNFRDILPCGKIKPQKK